MGFSPASTLGIQTFSSSFKSRCPEFISEILIPESLSANSRMNFVCLELSEVCGLPEGLQAMLSLILMIEEMPKMPSENLMAKMDGELNSHITLVVEAVEAVAAAAAVAEERGVVLEDVEVAALLDTAGVQVMVGGVIVLVRVPLGVEAYHPKIAATAGHLIVDRRKCHMLTEMVLRKDAEAGAKLGSHSTSTDGFGCLYYFSSLYVVLLHWFSASALLFRPSLPCCGIFNLKHCGSQLARVVDASLIAYLRM
ncbi:hypothetical protein AAHA92_13371 [Salvia divinorum]|uniref:Uncharacterized protein n=1 Tax=Salvia divinorum TaxID=28513 RepID=A0ABD1HBE5_SALDI